MPIKIFPGARSALLLLALVMAITNANTTAAPIERSVSVSRQFVVYGLDARARAALCAAAERAKAKLLEALQTRDIWKTPIVINARLPEANLPELSPSSLRFSQTGFGLKLQLDLTVTNDLDATEIEREITRALVLEMSYRAQPNLPAGTFYTEPPEWLIDGIVMRDRDLSVARRSLQAMAAAGKSISLADFLQQKPESLDAASREIYSAHAAALLQFLLASPEGNVRLAKFIADLPRAPNDPLADLSAHFSLTTGDEHDVEGAWRNALADFARTENPQSLTVAESEARLDQLLQFRFSDSPTRIFRLDDFPSFIRFRDRQKTLEEVNRNLLQLALRAHPICQPLILGYERVVASLVRGKTRHVAQQLADLRDARQHLLARLSEIDDYMNWFEATQSQSRSGNFADYLKDATQPAPRAHRHDGISVYLDSLEAEMQE